MHPLTPVITFFALTYPLLVQAESKPFATWLERAHEDRDWATVAEVASRWLKAEPALWHLHEDIARARLNQGDFERAESHLVAWEKAMKAPSAELVALRGDLAFATDRYKSNKAREYWIQSYETTPTMEVGRKLSDSDLWKPDERLTYEQWALRIAMDHPTSLVLTVAAESHLRQRDWSAFAAVNQSLTQLATRSAINTAQEFQKTLDGRDQLMVLDQDVSDHASATSFAKRAGFLIDRGWIHLALEDATNAQKLAPRAMLPRLILARCFLALGKADQVRALRVITYENAAALSLEHQGRLLELDRLVSQPVSDPATYKHRARLLLEAGQAALALADLNVYQSTHGDDPEAWLIAGQAQLAMKEPAKAKTSYVECRKLSPSNAAAWEGIATIAMQEADYQEAETCYRWLSDSFPTEVHFLEALQQCQARRQR